MVGYASAERDGSVSSVRLTLTNVTVTHVIMALSVSTKSTHSGLCHCQSFFFKIAAHYALINDCRCTYVRTQRRVLDFLIRLLSYWTELGSVQSPIIQKFVELKR